MAILVTCFSALYMLIMTFLYGVGRIKRLYLCILVGILSGVFSTYFSHDSAAYQQLFLHYASRPYFSTINDIMKHELFFVLSIKTLSFLHVLIFFCFYAIISFMVKFTLMEKASRNPLLSLLCFFALFFLYFDGTVVRVSLGIAIAYWGVYFLSKDKIVKFIIVVALSGLLFHYSLIVMLIIVFFRTHCSIKVILVSYVLFMLLYYLGVRLGAFNVLIMLDQNFNLPNFPGMNKLISYSHEFTLSDPFSYSQTLLFIASLVVYFVYRDRLSQFEIISFNIFFLAFLMFVLLHQNQVIQGRMSEIFRYSVVFIAPLYYQFVLDISKSKKVAVVIFGLFLAVYFFYYNYYKEIIADKNLTLLYNFFS